MKKKDLYKIVKEELEKELEEQRRFRRRSRRRPRRRPRREPRRKLALDDPSRKIRELIQRLKINPPTLKKLLDQIGISGNLEKLVDIDFNKIIDILKFDDKIDPPMMTTGYAPLVLMGLDCEEYTINDAFLCGGANNTAADPNTAVGTFTLIDGSTMNNALAQTGCFETTNSVVTLEDYISFIAGSMLHDQASAEAMLADYYEPMSTELDDCYGCTDSDAVAPDPADAYTSTFPGFVGDTVFNTGGSGYDPDAVYDDGSCVFFGCTINPLYLSDPNDPTSTITDPATGIEYPNVSNYNNQASGGNPYELSACEVIYTEPEEVFGCTNSLADNYDSTATEDDGSCEFIGCTDDGNQDQDWWTGDNDAAANYADIFNLATYPGIEASNYDPDANVEGGDCEYDQDGDEVLDWDETQGCTDDEANNYNANATEDDGSCDFDEDDDGVLDVDEIPGCTQFPTPGIPTNAAGYEALNFNPDATEDDGSCDYPAVENINACTDPDFYEYDGPFQEFSPDGTTAYVVEDDGSCATLMIPGCTDDNYFGSATIAPGAATIAQGILDDYNDIAGTNLTLAANTTIVDANQLQSGDAFYDDYYNADQNYYCGAEIVYGCTDATPGPNPDVNGDGGFLALNYDPAANQVTLPSGDNACEYDTEIYGCTDSTACNYNSNATAQATSVNPATGNDTNGGICEFPDNTGCQYCSTDLNGNLFTDGTGQVITSPDTDADGTCDVLEVGGCTDDQADNYDPAATEDNGSCEYTVYGCSDPNANNFYGSVPSNTTLQDDGSCEYDPVPNKCHDITARVCNTSQRGGKLGYPNINLQCVRINGQAVDMDSPATSQFKYPLPTQGVDASGNPVSFLKKEDNMAIYQVISAQITAPEDSYNLTDLEFGNCKGPVSFDPNDSDIKIPDFKEPSLPPINVNPLSTDQGTTTGVDSVRPDIPVRGREEISESKKIRKALRNEYMSSKEEKLKNIIKEALKNYKK